MDQGTMLITSLKVRNRLLRKVELFNLPELGTFLKNVLFSDLIENVYCLYFKIYNFKIIP